MAEQITVARPYAEAVFELAGEQNALPGWAEVLRVAAGIGGDERMLEAPGARLTAALQKRCGKKIEATVSVDPELIGGARVIVGDTVIDASVQGELQSMKNQLRV